MTSPRDTLARKSADILLCKDSHVGGLTIPVTFSLVERSARLHTTSKLQHLVLRDEVPNLPCRR